MRGKVGVLLGPCTEWGLQTVMERPRITSRHQHAAASSPNPFSITRDGSVLGLQTPPRERQSPRCLQSSPVPNGNGLSYLLLAHKTTFNLTFPDSSLTDICHQLILPSNKLLQRFSGKRDTLSQQNAAPSLVMV